MKFRNLSLNEYLLMLSCWQPYRIQILKWKFVTDFPHLHSFLYTHEITIRFTSTNVFSYQNQPFLSLLFNVGYTLQVVSDYGLDDRRLGLDPWQRQNDFFSNLCIQTDSGAHPASWPMGTGGPFPGAKARPGRDADHSPPSSAEVMNE
jgi:hypothetical protein